MSYQNIGELQQELLDNKSNILIYNLSERCNNLSRENERLNSVLTDFQKAMNSLGRELRKTREQLLISKANEETLSVSLDAYKRSVKAELENQERSIAILQTFLSEPGQYFSDKASLAVNISAEYDKHINQLRDVLKAAVMRARIAETDSEQAKELLRSHQRIHDGETDRLEDEIATLKKSNEKLSERVRRLLILCSSQRQSIATHSNNYSNGPSNPSGKIYDESAITRLNSAATGILNIGNMEDLNSDDIKLLSKADKKNERPIDSNIISSDFDNKKSGETDLKSSLFVAPTSTLRSGVQNNDRANSNQRIKSGTSVSSADTLRLSSVENGYNIPAMLLLDDEDRELVKQEEKNIQLLQFNAQNIQLRRENENLKAKIQMLEKNNLVLRDDLVKTREKMWNRILNQ